MSSSTSKTNITNLDSLLDKNNSQQGYLKATYINESEVNPRDPVSLFSHLNKQIMGSNFSENEIANLKRYYFDMFLGNVDKQNLLYIFGKGDIGLDILSSLNTRTNVKIESVGDSARTNKNGIATVTLRFTSGPSSDYYLQCQSGQAYTPKSTPIQLTNPISKITFLDSIGETLSYPFLRSDADQIYPTYIPLSKAINISIKQDSQQDFTGIIYQLEIKVVDYNFVNAAMNKLQMDVSNFTLSDIELINSFGQNQTSVKDKFSRLWNIVTTGASALANSMGATKTVETKNAVYIKFPTIIK